MVASGPPETPIFVLLLPRMNKSRGLEERQEDLPCLNSAPSSNTWSGGLSIEAKTRQTLFFPQSHIILAGPVPAYGL